MSFPPELLPTNSTDLTDSTTGVNVGVGAAGYHAETLHNKTNKAINDIIGELIGFEETVDGTLSIKQDIFGHSINSIPVAAGSTSLADLTMTANTILARLSSGDIVAADPAQVCTLLSLVIGTDVQAFDPDLTAIAALATTSFGRSLLTLANAAALTSSIPAASVTVTQLAFDPATQAELDAEAALARNADNLASGTVADARIAATIARDTEVTAAVAAETSRASAAEALLTPLASVAELAQDAVGAALTDSATVDFSYNDAAGTISAVVQQASITSNHIASDTILDANINTAAAIDQSKVANLVSDLSGLAALDGLKLAPIVLTKTAAHTAAPGELVRADASSAGFAVTLPSNPPVGSIVAVKKIDATTNTVTIAPQGGGTIDGDPTATTTTRNAGGVFEHLGANAWSVVASMTTTGPAGPQGPPGVAGAAGATGATGATGPTGPIGVVQDEGTPLTTRSALNFIGSAVAATDDSTNNRTNITVTIPTPTITVADEGSDLTTGATKLNFVGAGVTASGTGTTKTIAISALSMATLLPRGVGVYYEGNEGSGLGNGTLDAQNRAFAYPVLLRAGTLSRVAVNVNSAVASSTLRLGIWNVGSDGFPGTLLLDAGTVDTSTTGDKEWVINQAVSDGWYWFSFSAQGGASSANFKVVNSFVRRAPAAQTTLAGGSFRAGMRDSNNWSGALGSSFGTVSDDQPTVALRFQYRYSAVT